MDTVMKTLVGTHIRFYGKNRKIEKMTLSLLLFNIVLYMVWHCFSHLWHS